VHLGLCAGSIDRWGTPEQKQEWLPRMATGEVLGCFGLTEPDFGSNPADLQATAVKQPDGGYVLNGNKIFITNGNIAGVTLFMARTGGPGARGVSAFLVPNDSPGFEARKIKGKLGLRSCDTAELILRDVRVGPEALLGGEEGTGIRVALTALNDGRMSLSASCTGLAQAALDAMVSYTKERHQFGKPIAGHQLVQGLLAEMATELAASQLLVYRALSLMAQGRRCELEASIAKSFTTEAAQRITSKAIQVHGAFGITKEFAVDVQPSRLDPRFVLTVALLALIAEARREDRR